MPMSRTEKHVFLHLGPDVERKLDEIFGALAFQSRRNEQMFEELAEKVAALKSASDSATELLAGLKTRLDEAIKLIVNDDDRVRLQAISDSIDAEAKDLADAVAANTPV